MDNKKGLLIMNEYSSQFCQIAVDKGFVTETQLSVAIPEQVDDDLSNKPYRFIGRIIFEHGWITNKQINIVLDTLHNTRLHRALL
jgi:hypothetical protein